MHFKVEVSLTVLHYVHSNKYYIIINRPGVARAVLQSPPSFIHWLIEQSFCLNIFQTWEEVGS